MTDKPLRCFEGSAQPYEPFWRFVNQAESESGQAELELYGILSEYSWFDDDITPAKFKNDLYEAGKGGPVLLKVNSPGGDVIAASVMRAILTDYPGEVTARVDGIAASAAVIVTTAAKHVKMLDTSYMMIHDPAFVIFMAYLDIETLEQMYYQLLSVKDGILIAYEARTGMNKTHLAHMMADETWMSARQAVEYHFADEVIAGGQQTRNVSNAGIVNCLRSYSKVPEPVLQAFLPVSLPISQASSAPGLLEAEEREAQTLRERIQTILKGASHA
jgi:ATP-dependent Clp protease protease subunit